MRPAEAAVRAARVGLGYRDEAALTAAWAAGAQGPLRLADGRQARVVFPGVPGGGSGPDFRGAMVEIAGDLTRGDVEIHVRHSGWFAHGHDRDDAYRGVALHVVAVNDLPLQATPHVSGRRIPLLVLASPPPGADALPGFVPPCAFARAAGVPVEERLGRLGVRRLRVKANRAALAVAERGVGEALFFLTAGALLGPANLVAMQALDRLRLGRLLELAAGAPAGRRMALVAELRAVVDGRFGGGGRSRPAASLGRRVEALAGLVARWWPGGDGGWPASLTPGCGWRAAAAPPAGRAAAIEVMANAVIPTALGAGVWSEMEATAAWDALPSPGTYGRLRPLERWLGGTEARPFGRAARLQGGLLLQADYCAKGGCGRCPLSPPG